ncbi:recombinase family protein [Streptomyces sp. cf386]|uniref:recombinase family protein n=1 Tax=Streptomyces sp. cf386 TaxID=1761904 RepID=UPI0015A3AA5F|nr:recombinase family protein [Streptomyces sp. cf386]
MTVQVSALEAITVRLAGYIRVSTGSQLDGFGLEDQERIVRRWTREHGHRLVKVFVEKAVSGTVAGDERPELATALSWIEDKKVNGIVAPNLDRLARELVVQEAALAQTWKHGGRAFMADQGEIVPDDPEDPMRTAMRQMIGRLRTIGPGDDSGEAPPRPPHQGRERRVRVRGPAVRLAGPQEGTDPGRNGAGRPSACAPAPRRGRAVISRDCRRSGRRGHPT